MLVMPAALAKPAALSMMASPPTGRPYCVSRVTPYWARTSLVRVGAGPGVGTGSGRSSTMIGSNCSGVTLSQRCNAGSMGAGFGGGGGGGGGAGAGAGEATGAGEAAGAGAGAGAVGTVGTPRLAVCAWATVFDPHAGASSASATINLNTTTRIFQSPTTAVDNERCLIRAQLTKGTGSGRPRAARPPSSPP